MFYIKNKYIHAVISSLLLHVCMLVVLVISQLSVEALHICEDAFPIWLLHSYHILHIQQWSYVRPFPR